MADSIYKWSLTAASNDAADSLVNWREGQLPDTVNDSARAMMQRIAEWREDMTGNLLTTGTQPSYTLTTNSQFGTLTNGRFLTARIHSTNTGPATININGLGALSVRKFGVTGDLPVSAGDLQLGGLYQFMYSSAANGNAGGWVIPNPSVATGGGFASGTALLMAMPTAPTGWTKSTANDNKALRVVAGATGGSAAGGASNFTTVFASRQATGTVDGTAISAAQMPVHAHSQQGSFNTGGYSTAHLHNVQGNTGGRSAAHSHNFGGGNVIQVNGGGSAYGTNWNGGLTLYAGGTSSSGESVDHSHGFNVSSGADDRDHSHNVSISGATTNAGSGAAHVHTFTSTAMDFAVQYVDVIICTKD